MPRHSNGYDFSIAQLEKLLETRRSRLAVLERTRARVQRRLDALDAKITSLGGATRSSGGRVRNKVGLNDSIAAILKKKSGPMNVGDIAQRVLAGGYSSNSANFRGIVNQALIKDPRFAKAGERGSYQLRK
jgi:hypothetical protein